MATVSSLPLYGFAFNGFAFGGAGSPFQVLSVEGLEALPQIRNQDDDRGYQDGMYSGNDFLAGRTITITINSFGSSSTASISAATATGTGIITYTTSTAHSLVTGQLVTITGVVSTGNPSGTAGTGFNQTSKIATVLSSTQFTIPVTLTDTRTSGGTMSMNSSAQFNYNLLQQNLLPQTSGTTPLQFQMDVGHPLQVINSRVRLNATSVDPEYTYGFIKSQFAFFCPDPRYYDNTVQSAAIAISTSLGRTYNRVYPLTYGGGSSAITTTVNNAGWATTYPTITINGPINNPTIGNLTQGKYITISGSFTNTDVLTVNLDSKLVTYNGASARNLLAGTSTWFSAQSGNNLFYLTGTGTLAGTTSASVSWRNAYI
jgi:hypothetical protein